MLTAVSVLGFAFPATAFFKYETPGKNH